MSNDILAPVETPVAGVCCVASFSAIKRFRAALHPEAEILPHVYASAMLASLQKLSADRSAERVPVAYALQLLLTGERRALQAGVDCFFVHRDGSPSIF